MQFAPPTKIEGPFTYRPMGPMITDAMNELSRLFSIHTDRQIMGALVSPRLWGNPEVRLPATRYAGGGLISPGKFYLVRE